MSAQIEFATRASRLPRYWLLVALALLASALTPLGLNVIAHAAYGDNAWLMPVTALPLSQWWLVATAICGALCAVTAMHSSLNQARLAVAVPLVLLCMCALGASLFYLYAFLAFQGLL